jgi:Icc-related predicted phosphoesterase
MRINRLESQAIAKFPFLNAGRRANDFFVDQLPVYRATVDELPDSMDAIIATADLQGLESMPEAPDRPLRLLGEVLPDLLEDVLESLGINSGNRVAALMAGDFYTYPDLRGRGGTGDVTRVWETFADHYGWVLGVAGNHDTFGSQHSHRPNWRGPYVHMMDGDRVNLDGLKVAGLSGVIGNPRKNFRRTQDDYLESLELLLSEPTDIALMHEGPHAPDKHCRGVIEITDIVERTRPALVVRGHKHWPKPLVELECGVQILNVEATVVILVRE